MRDHQLPNEPPPCGHRWNTTSPVDRKAVWFHWCGHPAAHEGEHRCDACGMGAPETDPGVTFGGGPTFKKGERLWD